MKVRAPIWIYATEDKNARFFICLAWKIAQEHGINPAYYIQGGDVTILFPDKKHTYIGNSVIIPEVLEWFMMAKVSKNIWRFNFLKSNNVEIDYEITDDKLIAMWLHLYTHHRDHGWLEAEHRGLSQKWRSSRIPKELREWLCDR